MNNCGIYTIENVVNGKRYHGSTNNWNRRKHAHLHQLKNGTHKNKHLQRAWVKYGENNFKFIWEMDVLEPYLLFVEQIYLNNNKDGYNINLNASKPPSPKGKKITEEHRKNLSLSHKGKPQTKESNVKRSESLKGKKRPQDVVDKYIESRRNGKGWTYKHTEETKNKLRSYKPSDETKRKISESMKLHRKNKISKSLKLHFGLLKESQ